MDSPNPDSGEEWYHTNTQLFGTIDDHNRFKIGEAVTEPWNAPPPGATPTMDGFVTDYISTFTAEVVIREAVLPSRQYFPVASLRRQGRGRRRVSGPSHAGSCR